MLELGAPASGCTASWPGRRSAEVDRVFLVGSEMAALHAVLPTVRGGWWATPMPLSLPC